MLKIRFMNTESFQETVVYDLDEEKPEQNMVIDFLVSDCGYDLNEVIEQFEENRLKVVSQEEFGNYVVYDEGDVILIMKVEFDEDIDEEIE